MSRETKHELLELLEALCEERLTDAQTARLEEIVLAHRSARRIYLDYIHLHGTLYWDAARADGAVPRAAAARKSRPVERSQAIAPASVPSWRTRRWIPGGLVALGSILGLLLAVGLAYWNAPTAVPVESPLAENEADSADEPPPTPDPRPGYYRPIELAGDHSRQVEPHQPVVAPHPIEPVRMPRDLVAFIDEKIAQTWDVAAISPSPRADDPEWLRRVYLDLAGRIPTADEAAGFLENNAPDKRRAIVESLLASPDFNRHLATVWTNLLVGRSPALARPGDRDALFAFLKNSFARNAPWDATVAKFIAAEGPIDENPAGNFLVAHLNNQAVPATAITARIFLGTQVQCMQCHNHPFNDWTQQDFWELNAFFKQTELVRNDDKVPTLVSKSVGGPALFETRRGLMRAAYPVFEGRKISEEASINRRERLAELISAGEKPQLAEAFVNRLWSQLLGAGFTNPIDDMGPHNPPSHPLVLDRLSRAFVDSDYDVRQLVRWITATEAYQLSSQFNETNAIDNPAIGEAPLFSRAYPKPMTVEQAYDSLLAAAFVDPEAVAKIPDRDTWVMQFIETYETDENDESVQFAGSIPAALALMNGPLTDKGLTPTEGTRLHAILTGPGDQPAKLNRLSLATLGRPLTPKELAAFTRMIHRQVSSTPPARRSAMRVVAFQDVLWAMLNSAEFLTVP